jgi:hypothetical protein
MSASIKITDEQLSEFSSDVESLWNKPIQILHDVPTPIQFLREYVNLSTPVIIKNAFPKMTLDELIASSTTHQDEDLCLNVDVTPDGHGDTIRIVDGEKIFVIPEVRNMSFKEFRDKLRANNSYKHNVSIGEKDENNLIKLLSTKTRNLQNLKICRPDTNSSNIDNEVFYYSRQVSLISFSYILIF